MTLSPFSAREDCEDKTAKMKKSTFVNYDKSSKIDRSILNKHNDQLYIGDGEIRRAEKLINKRNDFAPVMRITETEIKKEQQKLKEEVEQIKLKHRKIRSLNQKYSLNVYDNPKFYQQSFNVGM